jgi:hypothetical protein
MIDRAHDLPITKQAEVLRISRGSVSGAHEPDFSFLNPPFDLLASSRAPVIASGDI